MATKTYSVWFIKEQLGEGHAFCEQRIDTFDEFVTLDLDDPIDLAIEEEINPPQAEPPARDPNRAMPGADG